MSSVATMTTRSSPRCSTRVISAFGAESWFTTRAALPTRRAASRNGSPASVYGEMVACDGGCDNWFHFACVGLARAPEGAYICDACGAGFGFRRAYDDEDDDDDRAIACLQENPKKPGTACNLRYEAYKSATTVAEFLEKGGTPADLTHDVGKGFVWYLDADDGRRPRGNQLLPVRLKNVRVLQCGRFAPTGPQTLMGA